MKTLINRADFVPPELRNNVDIDAPLPIGYGQTISQPSTVTFMVELLQPEQGDNILDIGSGSGWVTAILADTVGPGGHVVALEIVPELCEFGRANVVKYNFISKGIVEMHCQDATSGFSARAPYDKIIASASAQEIPMAWRQQLKIGGRLVAPVGNSIWLLIKKDQNEFEETEFPGFAFVPFVKT